MSEDRTKPPEGYEVSPVWEGVFILEFAEQDAWPTESECIAAAWDHHDAIARRAEVKALEWALGPLEVSLDVARRMRHDGTAELVGDHVDRIRTRLEELNDGSR